MEAIYLDHAATTPVFPEVLHAMEPYYKEHYGNPSASCQSGRVCRRKIEEVREYLASTIHARADEIYFTSGGTESDNWALKGVRRLYLNRNIQYITSQIEHHAVLHSCEALRRNRVRVSFLDVNESGVVDIDQMEEKMSEETALVSIMYANNETGVVQPVKKAGYLCKEHDIIFHTDAVQAYGHIPIDVKEDNIDLLSVSGHKFGGPKGVGFLYVRDGLALPALIDGGSQEGGRRAGTENVAGIIGMGEAARICMGRMQEDDKKMRKLRRALAAWIMAEIPYAQINGYDSRRDGPEHSLPGHLNVSFQFIHGHELVALLGQEGICISAGSACSAGSGRPSHVLSAMGIDREMAAGSIRISIGYENRQDQTEAAAEAIRDSVEYLRKKSPAFEDFFLAKNNLL